jgi:hypothetical protein
VLMEEDGVLARVDHKSRKVPRGELVDDVWWYARSRVSVDIHPPELRLPSLLFSWTCHARESEPD